jgi:hypothetical protein
MELGNLFEETMEIKRNYVLGVLRLWSNQMSMDELWLPALQNTL